MRNSMNMTEGSIFKNLIYFAIPVLIGNIFQQLYNIADTAIIGNILGDKAFAAVGASAPVYGLLIGFAGGMTNGFSVVIARYFGAQDEKTLRRSVALTYILSGITALIITAAGLIGLSPLMKALKTPDDIIDQTQSYMRIIIMFSAVTIAYNMLSGMMRAIGNSRTPLYILVASTFINVGLDFLFVKGFAMGVEGAAYATVISQGISVVICFIYVIKKCEFLVFRKSELAFDKSLVSDLSTTGISMGLMFAIVSIGSVILQSAVNSFGTGTVTAHTAGRKIDEIFMLPLSTFSLSASTFVSQNYGAGKIDRVKKGIRCSILIAEVWSAFALVATLLLRVPFVKALSGTTDSEVVSTACRYLIWNVPFFCVLSVLLVLRSSLQGVGRKLVPISGSVVELALKIAAVAYFAPHFGYFGICICEPVIWIACAIIVVVDYTRFIKRSASMKPVEKGTVAV